jgi:geranylgeranyl transferase type-1 subunit beta
MDSASPPEFRKDKHLTYWLRCLKTYLPWQYTSQDSGRMSLAFFILCALDLLGAIDTSMTAEERAGYTDWIYRCQHPDGGFRGFPGTDFGTLSTPENAVWDPPNLPHTYFALSMLLILRDDFKRVKRHDCLKWLPGLQRPDGSFGQTIGPDGSIEGGFDTRFAYVAMCVRWILRKDDEDVPDVDIERLVKRVSSLQVRAIMTLFCDKS